MCRKVKCGTNHNNLAKYTKYASCTSNLQYSLSRFRFYQQEVQDQIKINECILKRTDSSGVRLQLGVQKSKMWSKPEKKIGQSPLSMQVDFLDRSR